MSRHEWYTTMMRMAIKKSADIPTYTSSIRRYYSYWRLIHWITEAWRSYVCLIPSLPQWKPVRQFVFGPTLSLGHHRAWSSGLSRCSSAVVVSLNKLRSSAVQTRRGRGRERDRPRAERAQGKMRGGEEERDRECTSRCNNKPARSEARGGGSRRRGQQKEETQRRARAAERPARVDLTANLSEHKRRSIFGTSPLLLGDPRSAWNARARVQESTMRRSRRGCMHAARTSKSARRPSRSREAKISRYYSHYCSIVTTSPPSPELGVMPKPIRDYSA